MRFELVRRIQLYINHKTWVKNLIQTQTRKLWETKKKVVEAQSVKKGYEIKLKMKSFRVTYDTVVFVKQRKRSLTQGVESWIVSWVWYNNMWRRIYEPTAFIRGRESMKSNESKDEKAQTQHWYEK